MVLVFCCGCDRVYDDNGDAGFPGGGDVRDDDGAVLLVLVVLSKMLKAATRLTLSMLSPTFVMLVFW